MVTPKKDLKIIAISKTNYEKLRDLGKTADSFNDVINNIFTKMESQEKGDDRNGSG